ncbi:MAG: site-specific integrase [Cytophagales bacterium]|nr:site-specific integrase [Cytophagales bacterium]
MINTLHINLWGRPSRKTNTVITINIRITVNGKRVDVCSTGIQISKRDWDSSRQRIKGNTPLAMQQNNQIDMIKADIMAIYNSFEYRKIKTTAKEIKSVYLKESEPELTLSELLDEYLKAKKLTKLTASGYRRRFNKFLDFKTVSPSEVDRVTLNQFHQHLVSKNYSEAYIYKCKAALKMVLDFASAHGLIKQNLLKEVQISFERVYDTVHLSTVELDILQRHRFKHNHIQQAIDLYLFCCFTGLSYIDLENFTTEQIKDGYIVGTRQKTGSEYFLPLFSEAKRILERYGYELPKVPNQVINRILKEALPMAGIDRYMKFHSSRKTFANWCINEHLLSKDTVAKMMGQKDTKELEAYAKVSHLRVIKETKKLTG